MREEVLKKLNAKKPAHRAGFDVKGATSAVMPWMARNGL